MMFSERINFMLEALNAIELDLNQKQELINDLKRLKKYADTAEIVGHPRNQNIGLTSPSAKKVERESYLKFRDDLKKAIHCFLLLTKEHPHTNQDTLGHLHALCDLKALDSVKTHHEKTVEDTRYNGIRMWVGNRLTISIPTDTLSEKVRKLQN